MNSQIKIFKSLNCPQCKLPFTTNVQNGPRKFPICGLTICTQCFENIKTQRHQQPRNQRHGCAYDQHEACRFSEVKPAYFLIALLNDPVIIESPDSNGYYLTKQFGIPECVICQEEYSLETEDRKPCDLTCNHTICVGCLRKTGRLKSILFYCTICPICAMASDVLLLYASCRTNLLIVPRNVRNPPKFPVYGLKICRDCERKHRQPQNKSRQSHGCTSEQYQACCFDEVKPAYFLIDLLNSPAIVESPDGSGYYLTKQFDIPECVICQEEYSLETEDRKPRDLKCNHTICFGCVQKAKSCPICSAVSHAFDPSAFSRTNSLIEFLKELPEMTKQLEMIEGQKGIQQLESRKVDEVDTGETATTVAPKIEIPVRFDCSECVREFPIEDMFSCSDCSKKICASCVVRQHREHKLTDLFVEETRRISEETKKMVSVQINGYKRIFPKLHQQLVERIAAFENVLGEKVEEISKLENLKKTRNEFDRCKDYGDRFEQISEDYLPNLRLFDTNLQNLIDELKEAKILETETETEKKSEKSEDNSLIALSISNTSSKQSGSTTF